MLIDSHFHLDFLPDEVRLSLLEELRGRGAALISQTLTPSSYLGQERVEGLSLGFHPWKIDVANVARELDLFAELVDNAAYIGELGLDFSPRGLEIADADLQIKVLSQLLGQVVRQGRPLVCSFHAVRSVSPLLDVLQDVAGLVERQGQGTSTGLIPVVHWYSGSSDELTGLMRLGGYISVNPQMLVGKRGRAYVKQVPSGRLLLETDLPKMPQALAPESLGATADLSEGKRWAQIVYDSLESTLREISVLRGEDYRDQLVQTQSRLYGKE